MSIGPSNAHPIYNFLSQVIDIGENRVGGQKYRSRNILIIVSSLFILPNASYSRDVEQRSLDTFRLAQSYSCGKSCGKVSSCKEAVYQWCVCGYSRADGDNDGVPCEKLCGQSSKASLERVKNYKQELGCQ